MKLNGPKATTIPAQGQAAPVQDVPVVGEKSAADLAPPTSRLRAFVVPQLR